LSNFRVEVGCDSGVCVSVGMLTRVDY